MTASSLPTNSAARKATPVFTGLLRYFPKACAEVARLSAAANEKHNPGEPIHWSREKSNDHADCLVRHQMDAGIVDPEDGFLHDVKVAWRALAQLELALEGQQPVQMELELGEDIPTTAAPNRDSPFWNAFQDVVRLTDSSPRALSHFDSLILADIPPAEAASRALKAWACG